MKKKNKDTKKVINFLKHNKTPQDKFYDIAARDLFKVFDTHKRGKKKGEVYVKSIKGKTKLAKHLGISLAELNRMLVGKTPSDKKVVSRINKLHGNLDKTKKVTIQFTKHTFTKKNFFKKKPLPRRKKNEQYYFRAGLKMFFRSKNGQPYYYNGETIKVYIIPNLPVSHHDFRGYPEGYDTFRNKIQATVNQYDSLLFFLFNYFDVQLINISK